MKTIFKKNDMQIPLPLMKYGLGITVDLTGIPFQRGETQEKASLQIPQQVNIFSREEGEQRFQKEMQEFRTKEKKDLVSSMHSALEQKGFCLQIPAATQVTDPIQINTLLQETQIQTILIIAEEKSKAVITETVAGKRNKGFYSQQVYLYVKAGAEVTYQTIQDLGEETYVFSKKYAIVEEDGQMIWKEYAWGGKLSHLHTTTALQGQNAKVSNETLMLADNHQCFDVNTEALHQASATKSSIKTRGIVNGAARSIAHGLVKIFPEAKNCVGVQKEDILLLSENARADAIPNLEISNDEVQCSHSATVSHLDEEKLFYITSRGVGEEEAKSMVVEGFFDPLIKEIKDMPIAVKIKEAIKKKTQ